MSKKYTTLSIIVIFASVFLVASYHVIHRGRTSPQTVEKLNINGFVLPEGKAVKAFALTDDKGQPFTERNLQGQWHLLFFGFSHCGFVCPTTMAELNKMYKQLQGRLPKALLPQVVMISVDPQRDTVARMHEYVSAFNPYFKGARGESAAIEALQKEFHIIAVKVPANKATEGQKNHEYTINHSSEIMVIDAQGQLQAFLSYPHKAVQMAHDYELILHESGMA